MGSKPSDYVGVPALRHSVCFKHIDRFLPTWDHSAAQAPVASACAGDKVLLMFLLRLAPAILRCIPLLLTRKEGACLSPPFSVPGKGTMTEVGADGRVRGQTPWEGDETFPTLVFTRPQGLLLAHFPSLPSGGASSTEAPRPLELCKNTLPGGGNVPVGCQPRPLS